MSTIDKTISRYAKALTLSAVMVLRFGAGIAAFAQGLPPGAAPALYGSQAFHGQTYQTKIIFARIIDQFTHRHAPAQHKVTSDGGN